MVIENSVSVTSTLVASGADPAEVTARASAPQPTSTPRHSARRSTPQRRRGEPRKGPVRNDIVISSRAAVARPDRERPPKGDVPRAAAPGDRARGPPPGGPLAPHQGARPRIPTAARERRSWADVTLRP